jgi:hypothetical protein
MDSHFNSSPWMRGSLQVGFSCAIVWIMDRSAYFLDVEIFAHLVVRDWGHFLELQRQLLLQIIEVIETGGGGWRSRRKPRT